MNRKITASILAVAAALCSFGSISALADSTNTKCWSVESKPIGLYYTGYARVQGAYKIPSNPGYGLQNYVGKNIKQACFWYERNGKTVLKKQWTAAAASTRDYNIYSTSAKCKDAWFTFGKKGTTYFKKDYIPF